MESFNGNTIRYWEKVIRDIKREDSAILSGLHNFIHPHLDLPDPTMTLDMSTGIRVEGNDKILTLIQAAAKSHRSAA